jgi:thioredoxin 1
MLELTNDNFQKEIKTGKIVIDFWAEWCGPCKVMGPVFEELSKEMKDVKFAKVNVDHSPEIAQEFGVQGIPTFVVIKNGKLLDSTSGSRSKSALKSFIQDSN